MSNRFRDAEVLLEVQNLKQYFGSMRAHIKAVDDVSFENSFYRHDIGGKR